MSWARGRGWAGLAILLCLGARAGAAPAGIPIAAFGDGWKVRLPDPVLPADPAWDSGSRTMRLAGARNEVVAFQVLVEGEADGGAPLRVAAGPLTAVEGSSPPIPLEVFEERYVEVKVPSQEDATRRIPESTGPGWYPAQLVPLRDGAARGSRPDFHVFWIDVPIPREAPAGRYRGKVAVRGLRNGEQEIAVDLTVWAFRIPDQSHLKSYGYFGPEFLGWAFPGRSEEALRTIEREFFRMAHRHRLDLVADLEAGPGFDGEKWWQRYGAYIDGTAFTDGPGRGAGTPLWAVGIEAETEAPFKAAAKAVVDLFARKGYPQVPFLYAADEPRTPEAYEAVRRRCRWTKEAVGRALPCMVTAPITPPKAGLGSLVGSVDIWNSGRSIPQEMAARRAAGERTWVYNDGGTYGGPYYIDTPPTGIRRWGWGAWKYGIEAWYLWHTDYWVDKFNLRLRSREIAQSPDRYLAALWDDPLTFDETRKQGYRKEWAIRVNGDGVFFYPGARVGLEGPIATPQLKAVRRAAQDYEYLWLLNRGGGDAVIAETMRTIEPAPGRWEQDPAAWERARQALAAAILARHVPEAGR